MLITWYGHACFKIESNDYSLVIDPFEGVAGYNDPIIDANGVYATHGHHDHNNFDAVRIHEYEGVSPFYVRTVYSFHDKNQGKDRGENLIHIFNAENMNIVHLGDLGHILSYAQVEEIGRCDALLIPVGGFYTIDSQEAYEVCSQLNPRVVIPMHYRYDGHGLEVVAHPSEFLDRFPKELVKKFPGPTFNLTSETEKQIAFLETFAC